MVRYLGLLVLVLGACITHHSGGPFDEPWSYTIENATVDTVQPNGDNWDPDLSAPDPYVVVYINNCSSIARRRTTTPIRPTGRTPRGRS